MIVSNRCQRCGGRLPNSDVLAGGCPRCMLELGYETESHSAKAAATGALPPSIGRYRILRVIGGGGMGIVYEAEQEQPRRTVALKIIKHGMTNPELLWRFELETEALGRLQHPGIAHIYEAGTVDTGFGRQPYFAMELIQGLQPREFAESHNMDTRQRIELMIKICDAVHHAHQRGLIHRDLKPANILVDEAGQPKILDFGVVRATDSDTRSTTDIEIGQLIGTPAYMSPEQALADPLELDTRTDVYSLGVIFYELLTGHLPYTVSRKNNEGIQTNRENDPKKISTLNRSYRGDIETIVGTAMEKDKTSRYQSAFGLAIDLRRFLNDEPIAARPPSVGYQLRKFTRRNKTLVAGVAAVFLALVLGMVVSARMANAYLNLMNTYFGESTNAKAEANKAKAEADKSKAEADKANALLNFMGNALFGLANPYEQGIAGGPNEVPASPDPNLPITKAFDRAVLQIPDYFQDPKLEAAAREFAGDTYVGIGRYGEGRDQLQLALSLRQREEGNTNPETIRTTAKLADAWSNLKSYERAEYFAKRVVIDARGTDERSSLEVDSYVRQAITTLVFISSGSLANADQPRRFSQIEHFLKEDVIEYHRRATGEASAIVQFGIEQLLSLYTESKPAKYSEASEYMKRIVSDWRRAFGEEAPVTLEAEKQLLGLYLIPNQKNQYAVAEEFLKPLVESMRSTVGDESDASQVTINYLVSVYLSEPQPRYTEAETLLRRVLADARQSSNSKRRAVWNASFGLAKVYFEQGKYKEAAELLTPLCSNAAVEETMARAFPLEIHSAMLYDLDRSQIYGKRLNSALADSMARLTMTEQPTILDSLDLLAETHRKLEDSADSRVIANEIKKILEASLASARKAGPSSSNSTTALKSMGAIAIRFIDQERATDAEDLLNTVVEGYRQLASSKGSEKQTRRSPTLATKIAINPGNDSQTNGYQQLSGSSSNARELATLITTAAVTYSRKGMDLQAEKRLREILDINAHDAPGESKWDTQRSLWRLASWYMSRARYKEAQDSYERLLAIQSKFYGRGHTITRTTMIDIAGVYWDRYLSESRAGKKDNLRLLLETNLAIRKRLLILYRDEPDGETSGNSRIMISNTGSILAILGRYPEAAEKFLQLDTFQKLAEGVQDESRPAPIANLGWIQFHQGKFPQAEATLRKAVQMYADIQSTTWERYNTESMLGATLVADGKYDEARKYLENSYEKLLTRSPGPGPASGFTSETDLGERILHLYQKWGKSEKLAEWRKRIELDKTSASKH